MSAISETIVREFLEAKGFLVQQGRKFVAPSRRHDITSIFSPRTRLPLSQKAPCRSSYNRPTSNIFAALFLP